MKVITAMYTLRKGGSYDRFKMMIDAFLEKEWEVHCLSLTPIQIDHSSFHNHRMYFPFKKVDGLIARIVVLSVFPPWALWVGWRNKIDLLIAFGSLYAFMQGISKWILKRPMVTLIRGSLTFGSKMQESPRCFLFLNRIVESIGLHFSDQIITNNEAARGEILKSLGKKKKIDVQVLHNNIPPMNIHERGDIFKTREKYGISGNAKVLVTVGILNRGKNIDILINCLPKIGIKNLYLIIVGDGSTEADIRYKESLKGLTKRLGVDKQVIFTGWLEKDELWNIYLASDLFIMPSLNEGMPNAMLEALGSDLPCLGSRIPGIIDILQYDELMFDPLDEQALDDKIWQFFSDVGFLSEMKRLCQERKEAFLFDWKERVYEMVLAHFRITPAKKIERSPQIR
ncbi:MAG: glycosyltransferase family 4 protein [Thermodesulfobacteriota bacterium]|nr:glycosyltransferase family 4 protein [Thermodesulfobacteriota bacterium]